MRPEKREDKGEKKVRKCGGAKRTTPGKGGVRFLRDPRKKRDLQDEPAFGLGHTGEEGQRFYNP